MKTPHFTKKATPLVFLLLFAVLNSACIDLKAIRGFTDSSAELAKSFPNLANDLSTSCKRQLVYQETHRVQFEPEKLVAIRHPEPNSKEARFLDSRCRTFREVQDPLIAANAVLVSYMKAMGALAADDLTANDKGLEGLGNSLTKGNIFNGGEVSAIRNIAAFVLKAASEGYRRKQLKNALEDNNGRIQLLTKTLKRIIEEKYVLQLKNERAELRNYYGTSILEYREYMKKQADFQRQLQLAGNNQRAYAGAPTNPDSVRDPLPVIRVSAMWEDAETEIDAKIAAAKAYGKALDAIAEGHAKLYEDRNSLSSKQALRTAISYGQTIKSLVDDFRKTF